METRARSARGVQKLNFSAQTYTAGGLPPGNAIQQLLYLNPEPDFTPICELRRPAHTMNGDRDPFTEFVRKHGLDTDKETAREVVCRSWQVIANGLEPETPRCGARLPREVHAL